LNIPSLNTEETPKPLSLRRYLFQQPLPLETETCWFLLLGVLDLALTYGLLNSGSVREANPLARLALFAGGLRGLIGYKFALLTVVAVTAQLIAHHRLRTARLIFRTGIALQLIVVVYSTNMLFQVGGSR
jgi:hypothetical protein